MANALASTDHDDEYRRDGVRTPGFADCGDEHRRDGIGDPPMSFETWETNGMYTLETATLLLQKPC